MRKISAVLRQWCGTCQAVTSSRDCLYCDVRGTVCASCLTCVNHGKLKRAEIGAGAAVTKGEGWAR